jgi:hypothetical protein
MLRVGRLLPTVIALLCALAGCGGPKRPRRTAVSWLAGHPMPAFDPDGPPDALRESLERHLSRGMLERDAAGVVKPALADSFGCSADSLTWDFRLRDGLRFTDGTRVTSASLREALVAGLAREDHATREWLLAAVKGVASVRAGRPLPALGIETPDERHLRLRLATRDRRLLEKLAVPGVATPWKRRSGAWRDAVGVGPFRVLEGEGERTLTLVAARSASVGPRDPALGRASVDTLRVRFLGGAARVRNILRRSGADVLWPLPSGFLAAGLLSGWESTAVPASPERRLLLVLRADVPPLTHGAAREALARAINGKDLLAALDHEAEPLRRWLPGAEEPYEWPRLESPAERGERLAELESRRRSPGRRRVERETMETESYHVTLAFDADGAGAGIANALQGQLAAAGHYADLSALRGPAAATEPLRAAGPQATLVVSQALLPGLDAELALLVLPIRGPARGAFRTGWRTREFDPWILPPGAGTRLDPDALQRRLAADRIVIPLASLPWLVAFRSGSPRTAIHPAYGPDWTLSPASAEPTRNARTR